jgi:hypothetical protein
MISIDAQRQAALKDTRIRAVQLAQRTQWVKYSNDSIEVRFGIQILDNQIPSKYEIPPDVSKFIDNITPSVLNSHMLNLIMASDMIYDLMASHYTEHSVEIHLVFDNQPVLSTIYPFINQPPL